MYCINCGKELDKGNKFCGHCGTRVKDVNTPEENTANNKTSFFIEEKNQKEDILAISQGKNEISDETKDLFFSKEEPTQNETKDLFFSKEEPTQNETNDILFSKENLVNKDMKKTTSINQQKNQAIEKKKNTIPIIIIGIVGLIALIVTVYFLLGMGKVLENNFTLEVNKMSMKYDKTWTLNTSKSSLDNKVIYKDHYVISLIYSKSNSYISTNTFAQAMINENKKSGYIVDNTVEDITINGIDWKKITYSNTTNKYQQLFYSTGYEMYSFIYATDKAFFDNGKVEANKIMNSMTYDNTEKQKTEEEAKKTLIGEWDWGISGYFVITNNEIYLYKDSTKSMSNVMTGTYIADNKIPTNAQGYAEGIHMIFTINKVYVDGIDQKANSFKREYIFSKNVDGTYTIWNLTSDFYGVATKIK